MKSSSYCWLPMVFLGVFHLLAALGAPAVAATYYWSNPGPGAWNDPVNWGDTGSPIAGDTAYIENGGTAQILGGLKAAAHRVYPGHASGTTGYLEVGDAGSELNASNHLILGWFGTGYLTQNGGMVTCGSYFNLAQQPGSLGQYTLNDGIVNTINFDIAVRGVGEFFHNGGSVNVNGGGAALIVGQVGGSTGAYHFNHGTLSVTPGYMVVGEGGIGAFHHNDGAASLAGNVILGRAYGGINGTGTYHLNGGTLQVQGAIVNSTGTGTLNIDGGTLNVAGNVDVDYLNIGLAAGANGQWTVGAGQSVNVENHLTVAGAGTGTLTLNFGADDTLRVGGAVDVGKTGIGVVYQSGGNVNLPSTGYLLLGVESGSEGTWHHSGGTLTSRLHVLLGRHGTGTIYQTGGTIKAQHDVHVGWHTGSEGLWQISNPGTTLEVAGHLIIGNYGVGKVEQSDGHVEARDLWIGHRTTSQGEYELSGTGTLHVTRDLVVGYGGSNQATFTQTGGTVTIDGSMTLGQTSTGAGTYYLNGGTLSIQGDIINHTGTGTLNIDGGTLNVVGNVDVDYLNLGLAAGATGQWTVGAGRSVAVQNDLTVGGAGTGTLTLNLGAGDTASVGGTVYLGNTGVGTIHHNSGTLQIQGDITGAGTGTLNIDGGTLNVAGNVDVHNLNVGQVSGTTGEWAVGAGQSVNVRNNLLVGNYGGGHVTHDGGTVTSASHLNLAQRAGSQGQYTLGGGGEVVATRNLHIAVRGDGTFVHNSGSVTVGGPGSALIIAYIGGSTGAYEFNDGTLAVTAGNMIVGFAGTGTVDHNGGTATLAHNMYLGREHGGVNGTGTYHLNGGTLNIGGHLYTGAGAGTGTLNIGGGTANIQGNLYTGSGTGTATLHVDSGGTLNVAGTVDVDTGAVYQSGGTVKLPFTVSGSPYFRLGIEAGSEGTWHHSGGTLDANLHVLLGEYGTGTIYQTGGTIKVRRDVHVGWKAGSQGLWEVGNPGTLLDIDGYLIVGNAGVGKVVHSGGNVKVGRELRLVPGGAPTGEYELGGEGTLHVAQSLTVGYGSSGVATFTQTGGMATIDGGVILGRTSGGAGTYNLSGGTLSTPSISIGPGNGAFQFLGGTLHADSIGFDLANEGGTLAPGRSIGTTSVQGDYTQLSAAALAVEIAGTGRGGANYDLLAVTGRAELAGRLLVELIDPFQPDLGHSFDVITATVGIEDLGLVIEGELATFGWWDFRIVPGLEGGEILRLMAVPEPNSWMLAAVGIAMLGAFFRRRRSRR